MPTVVNIKVYGQNYDDIHCILDKIDKPPPKKKFLDITVEPSPLEMMV